MYSLTITRVKPSVEVQFYTTHKTEEYLKKVEPYNVSCPYTTSISEDGLTLTVVRTSEDKTMLENFVNEFGDSSSPMYESTVYEKENGIITTFSEITSV
jgi:hypothetical protein